MALNQFSRPQLLLGQESMDLLANATVAVFGIGGVGGYTVEALARSGVGHFVLVDDDKVCLTNINRQIIATRSSVGKYKVDVMKERILDINPKAEVEVYKCFYLPENADDFDFSKYSYVVDAVDTVTAKIEIIMRAKACNVPVISCMGAGNKLDPTKFRVADIYKTNMCPLAKVMRREMKKRGVKIVSGDTDNHLMLVDLTGNDVSGKELEKRLDDAHITCNKNTIPNDPRSPFVTSGVRLGTPAVTTRGMKEDDMDKIAEIIAMVIESEENVETARKLAAELTEKYPLC